MLLIAAGAVVATGASVAAMGLASMRVLSDRVADAIYGRIIEGDLKVFKTKIEMMYGGLAAGPSGLLDSSGKEIEGRAEVVDTLKRELLLEASIYAPKDGAYECVSTSLRQADGSRALGSKLAWKPDGGSDEPAIARGRSLVLGKTYITGFAPYEDGEGRAVALLFIGEPADTVASLTSAATAGALMLTLATTALAIALTSLASFLLFRGSLAPLKRTTELIALAEFQGDLTSRVATAAQDEAGTLARSFNSLAEHLRLVLGSARAELGNMSGEAGILADSARAADGAVGRIASELSETRKRVREQDEAIDRSSGDLERMAKGATDLDARASDQAADIAQSSASVQEVLASSASAAKGILALAGRVAKLKDDSTEGKKALESVLSLIAEMVGEAGSIEGINASIAEIASRTNLLGMNAAIEAAHAGDAGRGFAVVAEEIRSLSERSADGAKDSEKELEGLAGLIERMVSAGQEASSRLERIFEAIEETGRLHDEIGRALQEQDISNREVLEALYRMNDVARSVADASAAMRDDSGRALERMRSLLELSRGIEASMSAGSLELERISATIAAFAGTAQGNAERIRAVEAEMSRFKTA